MATATLRRVRAPVRRQGWPDTDPILLVVAVLLPLIGVLLVSSARMPEVLGQDTAFDRGSLVQAGFALGGIALALVLSRVDYHRWAMVGPVALVVGWVALIGLLFYRPPRDVLGAKRWFMIGDDFTIQPSEFVKVALIVTLAYAIDRLGPRVRSARYALAGLGVLLLVILVPIMAQPDLDTAITIAAVGVVMLFIGGARLWHLAGLTGVGVLVAGLSLALIQYQRDRLFDFFRPTGDPDGIGYQAVQAKIAFGFGGITGRGLGEGTQKFRLPLPDSDSVFAVLGEEFGLVGTAVVLVLFLALFARGIQVAGASPDTFGRLLAVGIVTQLTFQAFVNMGVVTGL
ncbi:MAG: FtsW/RodA/SpoVE family cell cycle protein, partial [Actinobacteria bacterium]|nr:FtsW/RodA/SpoVE family cell cycle protein [Actinomycetota bacterium]